MKYLIGIFLLTTLFGDFNDISKENTLKKKAKAAYNAGDYQGALNHYKMLTDSLLVSDDNVRLNIANAYFHLKDTANAKDNYNSLLASNNRSVKSVANQQIGIINSRQKKFKEALDNFKQALKADPANEDARYNYEMLKKILKEQEKQDQENKDNKDQNKDEQDKDNKDQQNKDQQKDKDEKGEKDQDQDKKDEEQKQEEQKEKEEQEKKDKEEQKKQDEKKDGDEQKEDQKKPEDSENKDQEKPNDQEPSLSEKLKDMNISEEKAKMILEALKNNEVQYIQQNKRKPTKKKDTSKPDW